jgi:hypothetical protein
MRVFDHTIKPILLYGSDIWGMFNPFRERPFNLKGRGICFFSKKKYSDSQCCWKKYSDFETKFLDIYNLIHIQYFHFIPKILFNKYACLIENKNFSFTCVDSETPVFTVCIRERPFNLKRGGGDIILLSKSAKGLQEKLDIV